MAVVTVQVRIPEELAVRLRDAGARGGYITMSEVVRAALRGYLKREEGSDDGSEPPRP